MKKMLIALGLVILIAGNVSADYAKIRKIELSQSTGGVGQPVTITVITEGTGLQYKYWVNTADFNTFPNSPCWVLPRDWTTSNTYTWTPTTTGLHTIVVWVSCNTSVSACNIVGLGYNVTQSVQPPPQTYESDKLFGYWHFWFTIISTFHAYYDLNQRVQGEFNDEGQPFIQGTDEYGDIIVASYYPSSSWFALLDPSSLFDRFYVFRLDSDADTITWGEYRQVYSSTSMSDPYPLFGIKLHSNPITSLLSKVPDQLTVDSLEILELEEDKKAKGEMGRLESSFDEADILSKYLELQT